MSKFSQESQPESVLNLPASLRRLDNIAENKSEYYFKDILVEPRKNTILKTYSNPFKFEQLPKKQMKKYRQEMEKSPDKPSINRRDFVFRDWIVETDAHRTEFFTK